MSLHLSLKSLVATPLLSLLDSTSDFFSTNTKTNGLAKRPKENLDQSQNLSSTRSFFFVSRMYCHCDTLPSKSQMKPYLLPLVFRMPSSDVKAKFYIGSESRNMDSGPLTLVLPLLCTYYLNNAIRCNYYEVHFVNDEGNNHWRDLQ